MPMCRAEQDSNLRMQAKPTVQNAVRHADFCPLYSELMRRSEASAFSLGCF